MEPRNFLRAAALGAIVLVSGVAAASDYGSIHYTGPVYSEARVDDGTWREATTGTGYGSIRTGGESYGHQYDNMVSRGKRRAAEARAKANNNAHKRDDEEKTAEEAKPTRYGSTLDDGHLTISRPGRGGLTQDEAMARLGLGSHAAAPPPPPLPPTPKDMDIVMVGDGIFYYRPCDFYAYKDQRLMMVPPPVGAMVFELSDSAVSSTKGGSTTFTCGGATYRRVMVGGSLVYQVAESK